MVLFCWFEPESLSLLLNKRGLRETLYFCHQRRLQDLGMQMFIQIIVILNEALRGERRECHINELYEAGFIKYLLMLQREAACVY